MRNELPPLRRHLRSLDLVAQSSPGPLVDDCIPAQRLNRRIEGLLAGLGRRETRRGSTITPRQSILLIFFLTSVRQRMVKVLGT